ncbi:FAD-dependent monooxygenase [Saccharopolyspora sp. ID03-671]|uniref:FAD binding domain-containing protein n=1 Tax=Saccharopolyspora sp. ID03-671 TaxID=3073066 RepID=UPI0032500FD7
MDISRIAVIGGSICGLTTALLLRDAGFDVDVYERSRNPLSGFGNGIVVQPELVRYLVEHGTQIESISVPSASMRYVDAATGEERGSVSASWRFTSFDSVYTRLLDLFGRERYHLGKSLVGLDQDERSVQLRFADGSDASACFAVGADGGMSVVRQRLMGLTPQYAGYVTWRGLVYQGDVSENTWGYFDDAFTYGLLPDGHLIAYPIPGEKETDVKRLNFQWYWNIPEGRELDEVMTDCNGIRLPVSVHSHVLCPRLKRTLHERSKVLTPPFQEMVTGADQPFVTVVNDAAPKATVFGRVALAGDAAITPRPHAAAGSAKAAHDAWTLAEALSTSPQQRPERIKEWEANQLAVGQAYLGKVRKMAARLQHGGEFPPGRPEFRFGLPESA